MLWTGSCSHVPPATGKRQPRAAAALGMAAGLCWGLTSRGCCLQTPGERKSPPGEADLPLGWAHLKLRNQPDDCELGQRALSTDCRRLRGKQISKERRVWCTGIQPAVKDHHAQYLPSIRAQYLNFKGKIRCFLLCT